MEIPDGFVAVGRLHSPHGLAGQIKAENLSWDTQRLRKLRDVTVVGPVQTRQMRIAKASPAGPGWLLLLEGITSPEAAKLLAGSWICIPESDVTRPESGWIEADLAAMELVDETGEVLGRGLGLAALPVEAIRVADLAGHEQVLPLEGPWACRIDPAAKKIFVDRELWNAIQ